MYNTMPSMIDDLILVLVVVLVEVLSKLFDVVITIGGRVG